MSTIDGTSQLADVDPFDGDVNYENDCENDCYEVAARLLRDLMENRRTLTQSDLDWLACHRAALSEVRVLYMISEIRDAWHRAQHDWDLEVMRRTKLDALACANYTIGQFVAMLWSPDRADDFIAMFAKGQRLFSNTDRTREFSESLERFHGDPGSGAVIQVRTGRQSR